MMWGKHLGTRTVLMYVHIVNKETGKETVVNDFGPSATQTTQPTVTKQPLLAQPSVTAQLVLEYDALSSEREGIEMGGKG